MVRLFYITSILVLGSLAAQAQKTVIEEDGVVKSVHKERGKKHIHITYYDNGQKKSWMKVTPEWVKEKEWYRDGQKKKHVVYSQVSFTADYKKYIVWDEEGNKIENKSLPGEAILVADYTEVGAANSEDAKESRKERHPEPVEGRPAKKDTKAKGRRSKVKGEPYERRIEPGQDNMKSDVTFHTAPPQPATDTERSRGGSGSEQRIENSEQKPNEVYIERVDVEEEMASIEGAGGFRMYVEEEPEEVLLSYQSQSQSESEVAESSVIEETDEVAEEQVVEFDYAEVEPFKPTGLDIAAIVADKRPEIRIYQTDGSPYETTLAEADMAFDNGEYDLAKEYYNKAAEENPEAAYVQDRIRKIQLMNWMEEGELVVLDEPIYSEDNPIPIDAPFPEGLVYRVQLVAVTGDVPYHIMPRVAPIAGMTVRGSMKRYMAGEFRSFEDAQDAMYQIHRLGNTEAFIIAFESGEYISVNRALAIERTNRENEDLLTSY